MSEVQIPQEFKQEEQEPASLTALLLIKRQELSNENVSLTQINCARKKTVTQTIKRKIAVIFSTQEYRDLDSALQFSNALQILATTKKLNSAGGRRTLGQKC